LPVPSFQPFCFHPRRPSKSQVPGDLSARLPIDIKSTDRSSLLWRLRRRNWLFREWPVERLVQLCGVLMHFICELLANRVTLGGAARSLLLPRWNDPWAGPLVHATVPPPPSIRLSHSRKSLGNGRNGRSLTFSRPSCCLSLERDGPAIGVANPPRNALGAEGLPSPHLFERTPSPPVVEACCSSGSRGRPCQATRK